MGFHPLANIFPLLEGQAFDELVADIRAHGVREPIWLHDGQILDGRNRWRAAAEAGVECPSREYVGDSPAAFVVSLNLHRRHLSESQRAMVAARLANMRQGARTDLASIDATSQTEAAELLNVLRPSVQRARTVIESGSPEVVAAVERGSVSVSAAGDVATLPKAEQAEIVARGEREILRAAKQIRSARAEDRRAELEQTRRQQPALPDVDHQKVRDGHVTVSVRLSRSVSVCLVPARAAPSRSPSWQRRSAHLPQQCVRPCEIRVHPRQRLHDVGVVPRLRRTRQPAEAGRLVAIMGESGLYQPEQARDRVARVA